MLVVHDSFTYHAVLVEVPQQGRAVAPTWAVHIENQGVDTVRRRTKFLEVITQRHLQSSRERTECARAVTYRKINHETSPKPCAI